MSVKTDSLSKRNKTDWRKLCSRLYRISLAFAGGYLLTAGFIAASGVTLNALGLSPGEASYFGLLSGMLVFFGVIVWAASTKYIVRLTIALLTLIVALNLIVRTFDTGGV